MKIGGKRRIFIPGNWLRPKGDPVLMLRIREFRKSPSDLHVSWWT